jgi:hypothetical protein
MPKIPIIVRVDPEILEIYKSRIKLLDVDFNEHLSGVLYSYMDKTIHDFFLPVSSIRSKINLRLELEDKLIDAMHSKIKPLFNQWRWRYKVKTVDQFIEGILHGWIEFISNVGRREDGKAFVK